MKTFQSTLGAICLCAFFKIYVCAIKNDNVTKFFFIRKCVPTNARLFFPEIARPFINLFRNRFNFPDFAPFVCKINTFFFFWSNILFTSRH